MAILPRLLFVANLLLCPYQISSTIYTITQFKPLHDDGNTLASNDETFELGFLSPGSSTNRYVGIWHKNIPDRVVWVANRDHPIIDNSSVLCISKDGSLVLLSKNQTTLWSTNLTTKSLNPIVQLLDTGNLILREENNSNNSNFEDSFLWQSFDYPCDTLLIGMKLGWDKKTGLNRRLTAWKNWDDPTPGNFSWGIVFTSNPELVMWLGSDEYHRSGPWNGIRFSGAPLVTSKIAEQILVNDPDEVSYSYVLKNQSMISIIVLNQTIYLRQSIIWIPGNKTWRLYHSVPRDSCDTYNSCGPYGNCIVNELPVCQCLEGFKPKSSQNWGIIDWTQGCVRSKPWSCRVKDKDGFRRFPGMKLPDTTAHFWFNGSMKLEDCKAKCMENCSCTAYANLDVRGDGSGCAIWFCDLLDLRVTKGGQDLYVRMATPWTDSKHKKKKTKTEVLVAAITPPIVLGLILIFSYIYRTQRKRQENTKRIILGENKEESGQEDVELPIFDLATIVKATNDFSIDKKLGQGGFGLVYKGTLANKQEIAVKRLLRSSAQGLNEFKNEVMLCAKLQHRNLVKVLGCCIQGEEKILVYEYMSNRSLVHFFSIQLKVNF